jgi:sn-glycerol 3-phosphate transport system substrate-binding protein
MRRATTLLVPLVALSLLATACGDDGDGGDAAPAPPREEVVDPARCPTAALDDADGPTTITFWHGMTAANETTLTELTREYNESQDRVQVNLVYRGTYSETLEAYRQSTRGQNQPNLVQLEETTIQQMIDSETAIPADACVEAAGYDTSDILPRVLEQYTVEDTLWPVPFNTSNPVLYYNRLAFQEAGLDPDDPPTTLEEMTAAGRAIVESGASTHAYAVETQAWYLEQLFAKAGESIVDNDNGRTARATEARIDSEVGQEVFAWVAEMLDEGIATNVGRNPGGQDAFLAIASRNAAMTFGTSGALGSIYDVLTSNPDIASAVELGVAPLPGREGGGVNVGGAALWIVDTGTDAQKAAAWDYASWLVEAEQQARWHIGTGYIPNSLAAADDPDVAALWEERPGFRVAYDQLTTTEGTAGPVIGDYINFREAIIQGLERVADGTDPAQALTQADEAATRAIQDYNRRVGAG